MDAAINTNQTLCTMNMHAKSYGCTCANNSALFLLIQSLKLPSLKVFLVGICLTGEEPPLRDRVSLCWS